MYEMARIARFVVPGLPHLPYPARQPARACILRRRRRRTHPRPPGEPVPQARLRMLCLLPDAEPRASHPRAGPRGNARSGARRDPSPVKLCHQRAAQGDRAYFQSRLGSAVMDEDHLVAAARYVALNPVRARLVARAQDWRWSSVTAHLDGRDDALVAVAPLIERSAGRFADWIETPAAPDALSALRATETIGRPLGSRAFLDRLAVTAGRDPRPKRQGRSRRIGGLSKPSPEPLITCASDASFSLSVHRFGREASPR